MTRKLFDAEMQRLQDELLAIGSKVQYALSDAVYALQTRDIEKSQQVISDDWQVNMRCHELEQGIVQLIAMQQPKATDLRVLTSMLSVSAELERIGDYAKGIGKINLRLEPGPLLKPLAHLANMQEVACKILRSALIAFARRDDSHAIRIPQDNYTVSALYEQLYRELFEYMLQNPHYLTQGNHLLWAAHNIERTADRVTNICERIVYIKSGQIVDLDDNTKTLFRAADSDNPNVRKNPYTA